MIPSRLPRLAALVRRLAVAIALLQGAVPAAAAVADGMLALAGGGGVVATHIEAGRTGACAVGHPADCPLCSCLGTPPRVEARRADTAPAPERLVPAGTATPGRALVARAPPSARGPPTV